jgi:hypothetical protein
VLYRRKGMHTSTLEANGATNGLKRLCVRLGHRLGRVYTLRHREQRYLPPPRAIPMVQSWMKSVVRPATDLLPASSTAMTVMSFSPRTPYANVDVLPMAVFSSAPFT